MAGKRHVSDVQHGEHLGVPPLSPPDTILRFDPTTRTSQFNSCSCSICIGIDADGFSQSYKEQSRNLAGQIAFLKMQSTRFAGEIADDAVNIFGGRGITKTGMGRLIEQFQRTQKFDAILGGAEEVLGDLGVRQA